MTEPMTEETATTETKPARGRKSSPIRILRAKPDGVLELMPAQPPETMTTISEVEAWMGGGRLDAGEYSLVRYLGKRTVTATPKTEYKVAAAE